MINSGFFLGLGFGFISTSGFFSSFLITGFVLGLSFAFTVTSGFFLFLQLIDLV